MAEVLSNAGGGEVRSARFGGLLEGRVGDRLALERAVRELGQNGPVDVSLEVEGARFVLHVSDAPVLGERASAQRMEALLEGLRAVVRSAADPDACESSLHCSELYDDEVVETHLRVVEGDVRPLSRARARTAQDVLDAGAEAPPPLLTPSERRQRWTIAVAVSGLLVLGVWQSGVVERTLYSAPLEALTLERGPYDGLLAAELEPAFGGYRVRLSRGPEYPLNGADLARLEAAAPSMRVLSALDVLRSGGPLEVRLVDDEGRVLARARARTAALIEGDEAQVVVTLAGRAHARAIELGAPQEVR